MQAINCGSSCLRSCGGEKDLTRLAETPVWNVGFNTLAPWTGDASRELAGSAAAAASFNPLNDDTPRTQRRRGSLVGHCVVVPAERKPLACLQHRTWRDPANAHAKRCMPSPYDLDDEKISSQVAVQLAPLRRRRVACNHEAKARRRAVVDSTFTEKAVFRVQYFAPV